MDKVEGRVARRKRLKDEAIQERKNTSKVKMIKNCISKTIAFIIILTILSIAGYYGYNKLIIGPRLNDTVISQTEILQDKLANDIVVTNDNDNKGDVIKGTVITATPETMKDIPVPDRVSTYSEFGILYAPKLGPAYKALITAGDDSIDISGPMAVDYYPETVMPGQIGNYLLAGHVGNLGMARFDTIHELAEGDNVYTETKEGWYRYAVTGSKVVEPEDVSVLAPNPNNPGAKADKAVMTMTTCYFDGLIKKRLAVWADFKDFTPRSAGKPADIKA